MSENNGELKGQVFNIQRYSTSDGPGIRTTVFLQGCPLKCLWCANPESQPYFSEGQQLMMFFDNSCVQCGRCVEACPTGATIMNDDDEIEIDRTKCTNCGACVKACLSDARIMSGDWMTPDEVMAVVEKDIPYYNKSGGGVTFSGGECLTQPDFLAAVMEKCYNRGLHICIDTTGYVSWDVLEKIAPKADLFLLDIKHLDDEKHIEYTGVSNKLILENAAKLKQMGKKIIIRVPLIPNHNNSESNMKALGRFMKLWGLDRVDLLPYHKLGLSKYRATGMAYPLEGTPELTKEEVNHCADILKEFGLNVQLI